MAQEAAHYDGPLATDSPQKSRKSSTVSVRYSYPRSKIKFLLLNSVSPKAIDYLTQQGYSVEAAHTFSEKELLEKVKDVHAIGVRSKTKLTKEVLAAAKRLMCVGCFCIGTDQTDLDFARATGIPVFNSPFANTRSVAELVIGTIIMLARQAGDRNTEMHNGHWGKTSKKCHEIRGMKLGIVGYGHVGSQLSVLAEGMGLQVYYYDIIPKLPLGNATAVGSLNELLSSVDIVSLHVPATPETVGMIGRAQFATMREGSYFVNMARGTVVDLDAAREFIESGHIQGAAFDVYPKEPTDKTMQLCGLRNTFLTPHIGGATEEAQCNIGVELAQKLAGFLNTGSTVASVNFPEVNLPIKPNRHRIINIHRNVPGVLSKINNILSEYNVAAQMLGTDRDIGYLMVEIDSDRDLSEAIKASIDELPENVRTRVIFSPGDQGEI